MTLAPANPRLLAELTPFVVATVDNRAHFDLSPFGIRIDPAHVIDPLRTDAAPWLEALTRLDRATFGAGGMPMPRWMFYDGAALPGGIMGFGMGAARLGARGRELLGLERGETRLAPVAMYIAVPTWEPGVWLGHNLASLARGLPEHDLRGLGSLTKAVALRTFCAQAQLGVTQWDSPALHIHTKMGPLELLTAFTPGHSEPRSLTYRAPCDEKALRSLARDPGGAVGHVEPEEWIGSRNEAAMERLERRIEAGERLYVTGRPVRAGGETRIPVGKRQSPPEEGAKAVSSR